MRLLLLTAGSRGDVEPFAALARRAQRDGHDVTLAVPDNSGVDLSGLDTASLGADFQAMIAAQGTSVRQAMRNFASVVRPTMRAVIVGAAQIGLDHGADAVIAHPKVLSAPHIAARLGAQLFAVETVPTTIPTREFPAAGTVPFDLGPLNRLTYRAGGAAAAMFRRELAEAARLLGGPQPRAARATLLPISPQILPRPVDWPASAHLTGAWVGDGDQAVDEEGDATVAAFLRTGPTVSVGFGSMAQGDPLARGAAFVAASRERGLQTLVLRGWGGADVPPELRGDDVLVIDGASHDQVFPLVDVAVHHGGAGTAQAAVRAGTPSVVVPFLADQPFWARTLRGCGVAADPLSRRHLTVRRAGGAIDQALRCRRRAAELGPLVAAEDGTGRALELIEAG
ncbi:glycosyltransferase [Microbacterium sp. ET2]|uniref:glycosyltransferase n=1 Tax=Microbacterium albipurpureum TaxID=3050384 RepID=UPI00259C8046|nr:glycosyltransferase [Microbacterium sp. ET2 (Ac-2212)]WJL94361.1 glycosyltransferase [Microbacterium sp. ET2 (Ac-2212)]